MGNDGVCFTPEDMDREIRPGEKVEFSIGTVQDYQRTESESLCIEYLHSPDDETKEKTIRSNVIPLEPLLIVAPPVSVESEKNDPNALKKSLGCFILFALPFAAVGVLTGYLFLMAILARHRDWEDIGLYLVFSVVFGGAGFGLMGAAIYRFRKAQGEAALQEKHPGEPWLHKDEYREGKIRSTTKRALVNSVIVAVMWNAVSSPLLFMVPKEVLEKDNPAALLGLLSPIVGVGLLVRAWKNFARWRKFGESANDMSFAWRETQGWFSILRSSRLPSPVLSWLYFIPTCRLSPGFLRPSIVSPSMALWTSGSTRVGSKPVPESLRSRAASLESARGGACGRRSSRACNRYEVWNWETGDTIYSIWSGSYVAAKRIPDLETAEQLATEILDIVRS